MAELKYKDITEKIIGAAFEVHKFLGNGFQEVIYQRALAWELSEAGLSFEREINQKIFYTIFYNNVYIFDNIMKIMLHALKKTWIAKKRRGELCLPRSNYCRVLQ